MENGNERRVERVDPRRHDKWRIGDGEPEAHSVRCTVQVHIIIVRAAAPVVDSDSSDNLTMKSRTDFG